MTIPSHREGSRTERVSETTDVHTRILRLALGIEESRSYCEHVDPKVPVADRALIAFEQRWFGGKSLYPEPPFVRVGLSDECMQHALELHPRLPCPVLDAFALRAVVVGGLDEAWPKKADAAELYRVGMQGAGVRDALVAFARDGETGAVKIIAPSRSPVTTCVVRERVEPLVLAQVHPLDPGRGGVLYVVGSSAPTGRARQSVAARPAARKAAMAQKRMAE